MVDRVRALLLTQEQCAFCRHAKEVLARLEGEFPLSVSELDIASVEGRELAERAGMLFPPGLYLDGEPFGYGRISERKLRRELQRRSRTGP